MIPKLHDSNADAMFDAVLALKDRDECYRFFEDLCTVPELKAMTQRFAVAKMLYEHRLYNEIVAETGASTATISRVNRALLYGSDGYVLVFDRFAEGKADNEA